MTSARNQHVQRTILLLKMTLTLCLILLAKTAPAAEWIDQSNLPEWGGGWTHVNPTAEGRAAMWQTFTPVCTNVVAVEIDILTMNPGRGDDVLTVEIAKDGDIRASAERFVEDGFDGLLRFEFPEAVPLVPEQVYELTVRDTGKTRFGWKYGPNTYERGSRYVFAEERPGSDWFFRTYSNVEPTPAKYSGGTGEPNNPYQIATAEDLIALGETPKDYDKHFILTNDIDLDPNLSGRKVFDGAVIAPDTNDVKNGFQGTPFSGIFDGDGHRILNQTVEGMSYLGLFGKLAPEGLISNLGLEMINIDGGTGDYVGGLAGKNYGLIFGSYSTGTISGDNYVGGLVGENYTDSITVSYSIAKSYSSATVKGGNYIGGLVGSNKGNISNCYSTGSVSGSHSVGGFVGINGYLRESAMAGGISEIWGVILNCYSTGYVMPTSRSGGLVGINAYGETVNSFWDIETSGQTGSEGGTGLTTAEMQVIDTYLNAVWDFVGEIENGLHEIWQMPGGGGYPVLSVFNDYHPPTLFGEGTIESPYFISTAKELGAVIYQKQGACYRLTQDIDLSGITWSMAVIRNLEGTFDGNDFTISNLTIVGPKPIGLIGTIQNSGQVMNLGVVDATMCGTGGREVGILVGSNYGIVKNSHSTGMVIGIGKATGGWGWVGGIGGLVGCNSGSITTSYNTGSLSGDVSVGGLVGLNYGNITMSYSTVSVSGSEVVGGLVGLHWAGSIATSYSTGTVAGIECVGGLVGSGSNITKSYSASTVIGEYLVGGLVGDNWEDTNITSSFWDIETSSLLNMCGSQGDHANGCDNSNGKTTAEMQMVATFLEADWDFVNETANGTEDIWWILEGQDYPRLWWEAK